MDEKGTLRLAKEAIQRGDKDTAQEMLLEVIRANPRSEVAWLWLSAIVADPARERECLERVLAINPSNAVAQQHLQKLREPGAEPRSVPAPEPPGQAPPPAQAPPSRAVPSVLEIYGAGLVLSAISPTFYWHAARRRASSALYFFVLFALILTTIQTLDISRDFGALGRMAEEAFAAGVFPRITLSGGQAAIDGPDPFVREFEGSVLIADTTGTYGPSLLRSGRYDSGFLLTRTTVYRLNGGEVDSLPLEDLQPMLGDPFVLDAQVIQKLLNGIQVIAFTVLLVWHTVIRLAGLALLAFGMRAVAGGIWPGASFGPVFGIGVFALVPATYGTYLLRRIGIGFCGLQIVLLLIVWAVGLVAAFAERGEGILSGGRSLRGWRALAGVPMLLVLALDAIFSWPRGAILAWGITLLTLVVLAFIGLWPMMGAAEGSGSRASLEQS
jgi:hypothetical protein